MPETRAKRPRRASTWQGGLNRRIPACPGLASATAALWHCPRSASPWARQRIPNVYTIGYTFGMLIETLSVREAREQLPSVLERFRQGDRTPVGVGSHRKTEAVMVPVEVFDELTAERARSLTQAAASIRAEGLTVGAEVEAITERWARGEISTVRMRELVRQLYDAS